MSASASKKKRKELEEQGLSPRDIAAKKEKEKKQKFLRNVLITVLCVAVALAVIFAVIKLVNRPTPPSYDTSAALATMGEEKITVPLYNYFYNGVVNQEYSSTYLGYFIKTNVPFSEQTSEYYWDGTLEEHFIDSTKTSMQTTYNYYLLAKEAGFELDKDQEKEIDEAIESIKEDAKTYRFQNVDRYLTTRYGEGCDLDSYEEYLKINELASHYYSKLYDEFRPSAEELQAAYDEDRGVYDEVSYTYATVNAESTTVPTADSEKAEGEDSEDGEDGEEEDTTTPTTTIYTDQAKADAKEKAEGYLTEMPEDASTAVNTKKNITNTELADWLFDPERKEGDTKVFTLNEDETSFQTVRFDSRETHDYKLVNANIITITKDAEDKELEEGEKSAKDKLDELLSAIENGMDDEKFSGAVTPLGYTVSDQKVTNRDYSDEIRAWLYDESRKNGDLFTEYSDDKTYYVVRYVSTDEESYRDLMIRNNLWSKKSEELGKAVEIVINEDMMQYANTDLTFYDNSSSES